MSAIREFAAASAEAERGPLRTGPKKGGGSVRNLQAAEHRPPDTWEPLNAA